MRSAIRQTSQKLTFIPYLWPIFAFWSYWPDLNRRPADYESIPDFKKPPKMGFFRKKTSFSSILKFPSLVRPYFGKNIFILFRCFLHRHFCHVFTY
nr:MAG TPA: hypothetical protein [Caudoviricetes sp.]